MYNNNQERFLASGYWLLIDQAISSPTQECRVSHQRLGLLMFLRVIYFFSLLALLVGVYVGLLLSDFGRGECIAIGCISAMIFLVGNWVVIFGTSTRDRK